MPWVTMFWRFWQPILNLSNFYNQIMVANSAAERVFLVLDTEPAIIDKPDAIELPEVKGKVEFKNVNFSYEKGVPILKNMSFTKLNRERLLPLLELPVPVKAQL